MSETKQVKVDQSPESQDRRKFLGGAIGLINAAIGIAIFGPVLGFVGGPIFQKRKKIWVEVIEEAELEMGAAQEVTYSMQVQDGYRKIMRRYSIFMKRSAGGVTAFDPACPHLGCRVKYQGDKERYFCPCHGGVFDEEGNVVAGPPPEPLKQYATKVEDGMIYIEKEV
jgi:Rieske Fe-S protein